MIHKANDICSFFQFSHSPAILPIHYLDLTLKNISDNSIFDIFSIGHHFLVYLTENHTDCTPEEVCGMNQPKLYQTWNNLLPNNVGNRHILGFGIVPYCVFCNDLSAISFARVDLFSKFIQIHWWIARQSFH